MPQVVIKSLNKDIAFKVTLAQTPHERQKGLMYRETLNANEGMLFIFPTSDDHSFWMKNTYLPLDMVFIDENWLVVGIIENTEPMSLASRSIGRHSRYVLEVPAGTCRRYQIQKGQKIETQNINLSSVR